MQWTPEQASTMAVQVDRLFGALLAVSLSMLVVLTVLIVFFSIRYRRRPNALHMAPEPKEGKEIVWTGGLLLLFLGLFVWAARIYVTETQAPPDALTIQGIGKQWMWQFQHAGGQREINELHVPAGKPVKVVLATQDVIHSFYVPAFRIKQDVVPGRHTSAWFTATRTGRFHLFCAEYCGLDHARMGGQVVVMEPAEYENWLSGGSGNLTPAARGEKLFARLGCRGCHGERAGSFAPSLAGIFGTRATLRDGSRVTVDEAYMRESILAPDKQVAAGFEPVMPSFAGSVSEADLQDLIAYIKSLSPKESGP